jgi:hypothetical protein
VPEDKQNSEASPTQASAEASSASALRDKRILPEGVVPKQAQAYVVVGLAMVILLAVMFSRQHAKMLPAAPPNSVPFSNDVNARKIAELEQNLSEEQRQSQDSYRRGKQQTPDLKPVARRLLPQRWHRGIRRNTIRSSMPSAPWPLNPALPRILSPLGPSLHAHQVLPPIPSLHLSLLGQPTYLQHFLGLLLRSSAPVLPPSRSVLRK